MNKKLLYIVLDIILAVGIALNLFVFPNRAFVGINVVALIITLFHQRYDERKYFKSMFEQGRPGWIWGWIFMRWMLTLFAIIAIVAGLVDYFG